MAQIDYGLDAPNICLGFLIGGTFALAGAIGGTLFAGPGSLWHALTATLTVTAVWTLGLGALMLYWSRVQKVRDREALLDRIAVVGDATVLDAGCGHGLLLIGAALRAPQGKAIGIDLWSQVDQGANTPQATLDNARAAGVSGRVEVLTGDIRALPFDDGRFDAVMSHWVVHNLPGADQPLALDEMLRVLKPGGTLLIADIANRRAYRRHLATRGVTRFTEIAPLWRDVLLSMLTFGSFSPTALIAMKPG